MAKFSTKLVEFTDLNTGIACLTDGFRVYDSNTMIEVTETPLAQNLLDFVRTNPYGISKMKANS